MQRLRFVVFEDELLLAHLTYSVSHENDFCSELEGERQNIRYALSVDEVCIFFIFAQMSATEQANP